MSNIFIGLKKTCLGVLERGERGDDNVTGLKEGGGVEILTTVLPLRDALSLCFCILLTGKSNTSSCNSTDIHAFDVVGALDAVSNVPSTVFDPLVRRNVVTY